MTWNHSHTPMNLPLLIGTEVVRWGVIVAVIYLTVWQYCTYAGYTVFVANSPVGVQGQFWGIFSAIMAGVSIFLYLPWRIFSVKIRQKYHITRDERWRPAIVFYILFCATPCFTLMLVAYKGTSEVRMTPISVTVLQLVVMGLVITEWAVKLQQEKFTFELVTAMALDFFFAYDVIAFVMMSTLDQQVYQSDWVYPCFVFAVVAMFKYVPTQPIGLAERGSSFGHVVCILTSMFCNDIPFVVVRLATMIIFGFLISDMIFLLKNIFAIIFACIQLGVVAHNLQQKSSNISLHTEDVKQTTMDRADGEIPSVDEKPSALKIAAARIIGEKREFREHADDVWCDSRDMICRNRVAIASVANVKRTDEITNSDGQQSVTTNTKYEMQVEEFDNEGFKADN